MKEVETAKLGINQVNEHNYCRNECIKIVLNGAFVLYLPGCDPSQLHQTQAHLTRLLVQDFGHVGCIMYTRGRGGGGKNKDTDKKHSSKRKRFPEIKLLSVLEESSRLCSLRWVGGDGGGISGCTLLYISIFEAGQSDRCAAEGMRVWGSSTSEALLPPRSSGRRPEEDRRCREPISKGFDVKLQPDLLLVGIRMHTHPPPCTDMPNEEMRRATHSLRVWSPRCTHFYHWRVV